MRWIRESFAAKLLTALVGMVGALFLLTYIVVKAEAARVVDAAVTSAVGRAERQLSDLESLQQQKVARLGQQVTQSRRTLAALDDAISAGDSGVVADVASQQLAVADLPDSDVLVVFTDPTPRPVLTFHGNHPMPGTDPVGITSIATGMLDGGAVEASAYRVVGGQLYTVSTQLIQLAGRPIGTVSFGLPLRNDDAQHVSDLVGAQVCYLVGGTCAAGSNRSRVQLGPALARAAGQPGAFQAHAGDNDWSIRAEQLVPGDAAQGYRVIAVPLDAVLEPFTRITDALVVGGGAALLISLLLGILLSRGLTRPVRALVEATGRVAEGDYEAHVAETSRDEMGTLARAFNDMTRGLLLKERYRSVLHKVVSRDVAEELMSGDVELGGENRDATVLFGDIRGFTALTAGMEPQRVIALLNECMERLSAAVEQEGGVVDKYVGDEIMAVFGAPVAQEDHASRAALSAVRMRRAIEELNALRRSRGEGAIGLGVGINTGPVVAGNMGSSDRLNYTVLGETVNLAARLCSAAAPGEILITARTHELSSHSVRSHPAGARRFKGFTQEIEVFAVEDSTGPLPLRRSSGRGMKAVGAALIAAFALAVPHRAAAQGLPTLEQLGIGYVSPSGAVQLAWSGQLDVELLAMSKDQIGLARGGGTFVSPRARLFTDLFAGRHVYGLLELAADGGEAPTRGLLEGRVEQAYVRVSNDNGTFGVQAGLFANPFGPYAGKRLTPLDLFVRPALPYDYRTVICPAVVAPSPFKYQTWRDDPNTFRVIGAPPVWQVPYPWGMMAAGTVRQLSYRAAIVNSAPSSEPGAWHPDAARFRHPSYVGALRWAVSPSLAVEGSYNAGPYMDPIKQGTLPAGRHYWDYNQYIWSTDVSYARGPVIATAGYLHDRWEVPNVGSDLAERGYIASVQSDLAAGVFAGLRWSYLDFRPWNDIDGGYWADSWDYDVARYEASAGYRFARNVGIVASVLVDRQRRTNAPNQNLAAVRWWWAF